MTVVLCVDNHNGILFNKRRQSQDRIQREHLLSLVANNHLYMNAYSAKLFENSPVLCDEDFLSHAGEQDVCFCENTLPDLNDPRVNSIILYKWNRDYPHDVCFSMEGAWVLTSTEDFPGSSHELITCEIYTRGDLNE